MYQQPGVILLREGTDTSQGKAQLLSNINACMAVADTVRTTLGPRGMDKLVFDGKRVTISNDGATIMRLLDVVHPAAKTLVDISMSQDSEVGDGTTSVVLLAGEILKQVKPFVEEGLHPQIIMAGLRTASKVAVAHLKSIAVHVDLEGARAMLEVFAGTALNSKLISNQKDLFAPMVVDAISMLDPALLDLSLVGVKKVPGGSVTQSFLVPGVAFKKTFSYAGFEQMTKTFVDCKVLLLNVELELKSEKENAEVRISDPAMYQSIVDAEWSIIYDKLDKCVGSGAQIILSKLPIGDLATQYFADRGLFCAGRVEGADMERVAKATGGRVQSSVNDMDPGLVLGAAGHFEEQQVGEERFNVFTGCPHAKTATIVLRGGSEQFIEESHRSVHDALCIVKRGLMGRQVVAGGGAIEMDVSKALRDYALTISGKHQHIVTAFAKALEVVPKQLCENAGFDPTNVLQQLRKAHADGEKWFGVDLDTEGATDTMVANVWEPAANKVNSYTAATEAACVILSIDETVKNPQSEQPGAQANGMTQQQQAQKMQRAMAKGGAGAMGGVRRLK